MIRVVLAFLMLLVAVSGGEPQKWAPFQAANGLGVTPNPSGFGGGPNLRQANVNGVPNSVDPSNYYLPGVAAQGISTSDFYHSDGFYWPRGWPLGDGRYFWPMTADHPVGLTWADGSDFKFGLSTDPQVMPDAINNQALNACLSNVTANGNNNVADALTTNPFCIYHQASFAIEPNDSSGIYHWYGEAQDVDSTGAGFAHTGTMSNGSAVITALSPNTALLVGGGVDGNISAQVTGSCVPANTFINTVDSSTQITLTKAVTGSCALTIKNPPIIHVLGAMRANNIMGPWTLYGPAAFNYTNADWSSYMHPVRLGTNSWITYSNIFYRAGRRIDGTITFSADSYHASGTGTDSSIGLAFQRLDPNTFVKTNNTIPTGQSDTTLFVGQRRWEMATWDKVTVAGQDWICGKEDARHVAISAANPASVTKNAHGLNANDTVYFEMQNPPRLTATVTAGSANVTALAGDLTGLQIGQAINWTGNDNGGNASPIWPQGTTITALNTGAGTLTASANATTSTSGGAAWFNVWSLPVPILPEVTYYVKTVTDADHFTISATPGGTAISTAGSVQNGDILIPTGGLYVSRVAIDASYNVLASPAPVRVSNIYSGIFPGPTYVQSVQCMAENGIMTYYVTRGFEASASNFGFGNGQPYNSGNHKPFNNGGALWHELVDIYSEIVDATAAASAAPMGVMVTSAAGAATLTWNDALPTKTYRLYRGTSPTVQTTLVGDVTGLTITDTPYLQTPGIIYYKLVYLNGGTEQGSRVVHTYVSGYTAFTNKHMTRVWDDGVDPATVDLGKVDTIYSWLVSHNHYNSLERGVSGSFGVKQDTSGVVSKAYDIGTTRMPRGNDVTFCVTTAGVCTLASTATYKPTGMNGTTPTITVPGGAFGVFGGILDANGRNGRVNNIRRKWAMTAIASYAKSSGSGDTTLLATGEFGGMSLSHLAGTPGTVQFSLTDLNSGGTTGTATIAVPSSATAPHIIAGTFGCSGAGANPCPGSTAGRQFAYVDGTQSSAGSPTVKGNSDLSLDTTLRGQQASSDTYLLNTGSLSSRFSYGSTSQYILHNASTAYDIDSLWLFEDEWSAADIATFTTLLQGYITPVVAAGSPSVTITSAPYSATCNGSTDDSSAFTAWNSAAVTWDAANPGVPGSIVLTIPNSSCMFKQGGSAIYIVRGIVNHPVRVVGAGASSKLSDGGTGGGFFLGGFAQFNDNAHHANTATVLKGSTSVALTLCPGGGCAAAVALFPVGLPVRMEGADLQGGGYPTNPAFWDYLTVACASTTLTCSGGNISFTTPLTHDYKSTWPNYGAGGGAGPVYPGGPGTLYALDPSWAVTVEYNNLIIDQVGQTYAGGKSITYKNVTFLGTACSSPSQSQTYAFKNMTMTSCGMEVDKAIDIIMMQNVTIRAIDYQSPAAKNSILSEVTNTSGGRLNGGGINLIVANSTLIDWAPGPTSFGCAYGRTYMFGNNITGVIGGSPPRTSSPGVGAVGSWSGGVYTISETDIQSISGGNPALFLAPGCNLTFTGTDQDQGPILQVGDLSQSGSNTMVTFLQNGTTYSGGLPTQPGTAFNLVAHPAPQLFASGNYGSAAAIDMNQTPPGAPMGSYSKLIVAGTNGSYSSVPASGSPTITGNPSTPYTVPVWGQMVGVNITVGTAYGGSTGTMHFDLNSPFFEVLGSSTRGQWSTFEINAKVASATPRFLGPTSTSGAQSGDTLTSPSGGANTWFVTGQQQPVYSSIPMDFAGTSTTIEIITNQGVFNPTQQ